MGTLLRLPAEEGLLYPREALRGLRTALVGFCAAFLGRQDCAWIEDAGLVATCVDLDADRLDEMRELYPGEWSFVCDDIYRYAKTLYAFGYQFDLVSLDPPTNQFTRCADNAELWCALARRLVVLGTGRYTSLVVPDGWALSSTHYRSDFQGGVYWTTLVPA